MSANTAALQQLYVAYFNRPADPAGLAYWDAQLTAGKATLAGIANSFAQQPEYTSTFAGKTNVQVINDIYHNLFGHDADAPGLLYWANQLATNTVKVGDIALAVANGPAAGSADAAAVSAKVTAATGFTDALNTAPEIVAYDSPAALAAAKLFLGSVVDAATLATAVANTDSTIATIVTTYQGSTGMTFNLTNGVDTFTGGAANDTFNAGPTIVIDPSNGNQSVVDSLQVVDKLDGGAGIDSLNATLSTGSVTPTLTGIENVNVTFAGSATIDLANASGVTTAAFVKSTNGGGLIDHVGGASLAVSNQTVNAAFDHSTATSLNLSLNTVGTSSSAITVDLGATVAAKATTLAITANNAFANIASTAASAVTKTVTVAATGSNIVKLTDQATTVTTLTVTGSGSVDFSGVALTKLATLTAGDGGVKVNATGNTATALTATTGAGNDTLTLTGANLTSASTGAGNDKVTITSALAATSVVDLGAGDDSLTLNVAPTGGATLTGGVGTDTIGMTAAIYTAVSALTAPQLAKITGFEVLSLSDTLVTGSYDVSKIAGIGSFTAAGGITALNTATITNLGANATVTLAGANTTGIAALVLKTDTGSDVLNLALKQTYTENNDATATVSAATQLVTANGIETLNVNASGTASTKFLGAAGTKADGVITTLTLTDDALATLNVTGNQQLKFVTAASQTALTTIDASANTGGVTIDAHLSAATSPALTIKGSLTAANILTGGLASDTIVGGAKADTITGGAGGDTLTGGAGNDTFVFAAGDSTIATGNTDTITDFVANTVGNGTNGAVNSTGAVTDATKVTGDIISLTHTGTTAVGGTISVQVVTNAADAQTFLQTAFASDAGANVHAALNSATGDLYVDLDGNGTADMYIHLTGVTTINAAAFHVV